MILKNHELIWGNLLLLQPNFYKKQTDFKIHFNMKKKWRILIVVLVAVLFLAPLFFYVLNFHSCEISGNPEHWAWFGDYIGGVYGILVAMLVVYLTYQLEQLKTRKSKTRNIAEDLNDQIDKLRRNNYNLKTCGVFLSTIQKYRMYITERQYEMFRALADHYMVMKNNTNTDVKVSGINKELEERVIKELNSMYNE